MIKYYTNRELSDKFCINLAKLKRWSREFLTPDPLGGMQSGYPRQYTTDDAFILFLSGHLVGGLNISIPFTKQIIKDLKDWFDRNGFMFNPTSGSCAGHGIENLISEQIITIFPGKNDNAFNYHIRGVITKRPVNHHGFDVIEERYVETWISPNNDTLTDYEMRGVKIVFITKVLGDFVKKLDIDAGCYRAL